jgi:sialate O-acetylesterase
MTLVSMTFDDCLDAHLDNAAPTLDRLGLKGSFFVDLGSSCFARRFDEWRLLAENGHELGNHTIFHPGVASKPWVTEGIALENYSLDRMRRELVVASNVLKMVDGRSERTFAFPCSNPSLGHPGWPRRLLTRLGLHRTRLMGWIDRFGLDFGSKLVDYTSAVRELFVVARCGGLPVQSLPKVPEDRFQVRGVEGDGLNAEQLLAVVDAAVAKDVWLVLVFHGIGGGHHLSCDVEAFDALCQRLATDPKIKVVTFLDGAKQIWT